MRPCVTISKCHYKHNIQAHTEWAGGHCLLNAAVAAAEYEFEICDCAGTSVSLLLLSIQCKEFGAHSE